MSLKKQKQLLSPRGYLSPTQISLWLQSPDKYYRKYMLGEDTFTTKEMGFGGIIAKALEDDTATEDLLTDMVITKLTKLPLREYELKQDMKSPYGVITLLGKLDTFDEIISEIGEYKTGKEAWTQNRIDKSIQLIHYALLVYLKTGKLPSKVWLEWAETEDYENGIRFTGNVKRFYFEVTMTKIIEYMTTVTKVAVEIDKLYRQTLGI